MSGLGQDFAELYDRELERLIGEIDAYDEGTDLWRTLGAQKNAPGTLVLHLVGNLRYYVGAGLGDTGYVRDRPAEFGDRGLTAAELARAVERCREEIVPVLEGLSDIELEGAYPAEAPPRMAGISTRAFLLHLLWHLGWHLGQIYYHRLGLEGRST